jgi:hypothetical protein
MCPGHDESAGKRRGGATRDGNPWLKAALAQAARRAKASYLAAQFHRLTVRRGRKRAVVAVGHAIVEIVYDMLRDGTPCRNLGADHRDDRRHQAAEQRLLHKPRGLGYTVSREPAVA